MIKVKSYSRHVENGDIDTYIAQNHANPNKYIEYRKKWNENAGNLLFLMIETASKCNLRCPMCTHSYGYDHVEDMSERLFDRIVENIKEMEILSICMNKTNEPLIDKDIAEKTRKIAEKDSVVDIHMNTNAVLLDEEFGNKIIDSGLTRLLIGFDGYSREVYENVRVGAKYERVFNNIIQFIELKEKKNARFPVIRLSFVKTSVNEHEVNDWIDFWKEKVDYVMIQEYVSETLDDSKDYLFPSDLKKDKVSDISGRVCNQPFERTAIRGNGEVIPCCFHKMVEFPIGNLNGETLAEIWYGKNVSRLRQMIKDNEWANHPICSKCLSSNIEL